MSKNNNPRSKKKKKVNILRLSIASIIIIGFIALGALSAYIFKIIVTSPDINLVLVRPQGYTTFIYDRNGEEADRLHGVQNRVYVTLDKIPKYVQDAVVCVEDKRFYSHNGIDYKGLVRAAITNIRTFSLSEGASTLTQQLIKNNLLTMDKKFERKFREQYLALVLESKLRNEYGKESTKASILELYLNTINLGKGCNGFQAAAHRYIGKDISELNLSESTVLAAIIQNPSYYDPVKYPENNRKRRAMVLEKMLDQKTITKEEYNEAIADDPYQRINDYNVVYLEANGTNSYFVDQIIEEVKRDLMALGVSESAALTSIYSGGLKIYSTMDKSVQNAIDKTFSDMSSTYATNAVEYTLIYNLDIKRPSGEYKYHQKTTTIKKKEDALDAIASLKASLMEEGDEVSKESHYLVMQPQSAMVVIDYTNGHVVGISGGRGEKQVDRDLNRATQSVRQTGSTFKTLAAFIPAIDMKVATAATVFDDVPYVLTGYGNKEITNWYSNNAIKWRGLSTLREGTRDSMNIIAVKTLMEIGIENSYRYLKNFGFTTLVDSRRDGNQVLTDKSPSLALGGLTDGVSLLELTAAYGAVANQGKLVSPIFYTKVEDINGQVILSNEVQSSKQVISPETAFIATSMMRDVVTGGTGTTAGLSNVPVAGKTGTTSNNYDLTFVGYSPYYVAGIWLGYDKNKTITGDQSLHTKTWRTVMAEVHKGKTWKEFPRPSTILTASVCKESGKLAVEGLCDHDQRGSTIYSEYFAPGTIPTEYCDVHVRANVVQVGENVYLANPALLTPEAVIESRVFIRRPDGTSYRTSERAASIGDAKYEVPTTYFNPFGVPEDEIPPDEDNPDLNEGSIEIDDDDDIDEYDFDGDDPDNTDDDIFSIDPDTQGVPTI